MSHLQCKKAQTGKCETRTGLACSCHKPLIKMSCFMAQRSALPWLPSTWDYEVLCEWQKYKTTASIRICMYVCLCIYTHTCTHTYLYIYISIYLYIYTTTYMPIYMYQFNACRNSVSLSLRSSRGLLFRKQAGSGMYGCSGLGKCTSIVDFLEVLGWASSSNPRRLSGVIRNKMLLSSSKASAS